MLSTALFCTSLAVACSDSATSPTPSAVATLTVAGETFRVALTSADQIAAARAAQNGAAARIPIGRIGEGPEVNTGWSWHLEDVTFAEATAELCDGRPSDVENTDRWYGGGHFCPWAATITRID